MCDLYRHYGLPFLLAAEFGRGDGRRGLRVRHLHVRRARHADPAVPAPVPVQLVRRLAALPGQQLPHLPRAVPGSIADSRAAEGRVARGGRGGRRRQLGQHPGGLRARVAVGGPERAGAARGASRGAHHRQPGH